MNSFEDSNDLFEDNGDVEEVNNGLYGTFELKNDNESEMDNEEDEGEEESTKRPINYQIGKNKGLTPKRNKLYRNPRVRHREKYRKALKKRKSIVPKVRTEMKRYSGETTGIRTNVIKGTKLK
jgi:U3 small nucleolar RNA-associated protein 3